MSEQAGFSVKQFFLRTKHGRMTLLGLFLTGVFVALPYGCSGETSPGTGEDVEGKDPKSSAVEDLRPDSPTGFGDTLTLGEKYKSLIARWGSELSTAKNELSSARKEIGALRKDFDEERARNASEKRDLVAVLDRLKQGVGTEIGVPVVAPIEGHDDLAGSAPGVGLRPIVFSKTPPQEDEADRFVRIPTASGGVATLLNGVVAPTSGEPSPVRLRFDAALIGPNRSRIGIRNAYLIGKAQGDPNSSRVLIQIDRLSYVAGDGKAFESRALGYVVGNDGLEGVPGSYEWRALELLPLAVTSGAVTGGTEALALGEVTRAVTPLGGSLDTLSGDPLRYAGLRAAGSGSSKVTELLVERMREIHPAVSTPSGGEVEVVFLEGLTLEGLTHAEIENESSDDPFHGLDSHR